MRLNNLALFLFILIMSFNSTALQANVTQNITSTEVTAGQTFELDIQVSGDAIEEPDLSMIPAAFTIVSQSEHSSIQIFNGRRNVIKGWKIKLKTLHPGEHLIPAIPVGSQSTNPIHVLVKESTHEVSVNGIDKAIFLTTEVSDLNPYVQQQVILTISLYRAVSTHYENLSTPTAENAIIEKLGDDKVFEKMIDNKRYNVYQRRYVVFPQISGEFEIGRINFTADVNDQNRKRGGYFLSSTRPISVTTKPLKLAIKAKPEHAASPWMPATNVSLAGAWSDTTAELKVGEPITWTVALKVDGLSEAQLPEIQLPKIDGLNIYPDTPNKKRALIQNGIVGERIEKFAVIPSKSGTIKIPDLEIPWWDTLSNTQQIAKLSGRTFTVVAAANPTATQTVTPNLPELPKAQPSEPSQAAPMPWKFATIFFGIAWILTLIAYFLKKSPTNTPAPVNKLVINNAQLKDQKVSLKEAKDAIARQDAKSLEQLLVMLANNRSSKSIRSIGQLIDTIDSSELTEKLSQLERTLYAASQKPSQFPINISDVDRILEQVSQQSQSLDNQAIPPLYPR